MSYKTIFQKSQIANFPWIQLGDDISLGCGNVTAPLDSGPGFACLAYAHLTSHQMHPIHAVPPGGESAHALIVSGGFVYPEPCDTTHDASATSVRSIRSGDLPLAIVVDRDEMGQRIPPPWDIRNLYRATYEIIGHNHAFATGPMEAPYLDTPCYAGGEVPLSDQGRVVLPIMRLAGWVGFWVRFVITGTLPHSIKHSEYSYQNQFLDESIDMPRMFLASMAASSWDIGVDDINESASPPYSLWGQPSANICDQQSVSFQLFTPVYTCDEVFAMWLSAPADIEFFLGYPFSPQWQTHRNFAWTIQAQLVPGWMVPG